MEDTDDNKKSNLIYYALVLTSAFLVVIWIWVFDLTLTEILIALIPNILCNFLTFFAVRHFIPDIDKSDIMKSVKTDIDSIKLFTNKFSKAFPDAETLQKIREINTDENNQAKISEWIEPDPGSETAIKLYSHVKIISKSVYDFKKKYTALLPFLMALFEERVNEIHHISNGYFEFRTEIHRESFVTKLFEYLHTIPNLKKIQSLTWDYQDYFFDYWKSYVTYEEFKKRNSIARNLGVYTERIFILQKDKMSEDKRALLKRIYDFNSMHPTSTIRWFYEEDLKGDLVDFKESRSSFLLLMDDKGHVKMITENFQIEEKSQEKSSNMRIIDTYETIEQQTRFKKLWKQNSRAVRDGEAYVMNFQ